MSNLKDGLEIIERALLRYRKDLDRLSTMTRDDLRRELKIFRLSVSGTKSQLLSRLESFLLQNIQKYEDLKKSLENQISHHQSVQEQKKERRGRPSLGVTRKVSITLSEEIWEKIDHDCVPVGGRSALLRYLIESHYGVSDDLPF